jgi:hypothetical protein
MANDFPTFMQKYLARIQNKIFENQNLSWWLPSWWRTNATSIEKAYRNSVTNYSARMYCKGSLDQWLGKDQQPNPSSSTLCCLCFSNICLQLWCDYCGWDLKPFSLVPGRKYPDSSKVPPKWTTSHQCTITGSLFLAGYIEPEKLYWKLEVQKSVFFEIFSSQILIKF